MPFATNSEGYLQKLPTLPKVERPDGSLIWPDEREELAIRSIGASNVGNGVLFFKPDKPFISWLKTYANRRLIVDIGCGSGYLLRQLKLAGYGRCAGIEPRWDPTIEQTLNRWPIDKMLQVVRDTVAGPTSQELLQKAVPDNVLFLCCRPSHNGFCADALRLLAPGVEFLYISKPENIERYGDLAEFEDLAREISFEGSGEEGERVFSIIKP